MFYVEEPLYGSFTNTLEVEREIGGKFIPLADPKRLTFPSDDLTKVVIGNFMLPFKFSGVRTVRHFVLPPTSPTPHGGN